MPVYLRGYYREISKWVVVLTEFHWVSVCVCVCYAMLYLYDDGGDLYVFFSFPFSSSISVGEIFFFFSKRE
ncbi:hypothetical protein F4809DRAFT_633150 [Biscogniauxia mediterranea]|nr:hypothetical protein F4809DRAFT_633150 [Biscogniauxia mediterranea]